VTQIRNDTAGRAYFERKLAEGKTKKEALRALKRRIPTPSIASSSSTLSAKRERAREGNQGRLSHPARPADP
jgi:transposase